MTRRLAGQAIAWLALVTGLAATMGCGEVFTAEPGAGGSATTTSSTSSTTSPTSTSATSSSSTSGIGGAGAGGAAQAGAAQGGQGQGGGGGNTTPSCGPGWDVPDSIGANSPFDVQFTDGYPWPCVQFHVAAGNGAAVLAADVLSEPTYTWSTTVPGQPVGQFELSFHHDCPGIDGNCGTDCAIVSSCMLVAQ